MSYRSLGTQSTYWSLKPHNHSMSQRSPATCNSSENKIPYNTSIHLHMLYSFVQVFALQMNIYEPTTVVTLRPLLWISLKLQLWVKSQRKPWPVKIIICLDIFWTEIIFLCAYPQFVYYNCVLFNQYWFLRCSKSLALNRSSWRNLKQDQPKNICFGHNWPSGLNEKVINCQMLMTHNSWRTVTLFK